LAGCEHFRYQAGLAAEKSKTQLLGGLDDRPKLCFQGVQAIFVD
jgi:hypothetical protein